MRPLALSLLLCLIPMLPTSALAEPPASGEALCATAAGAGFEGSDLAWHQDPARPPGNYFCTGVKHLLLGEGAVVMFRFQVDGARRDEPNMVRIWAHVYGTQRRTSEINGTLQPLLRGLYAVARKPPPENVLVKMWDLGTGRFPTALGDVAISYTADGPGQPGALYFILIDFP